METNKIYQGDALGVLKTFPDESIDCCMTSPSYWNQRDYHMEGQLGLEPTEDEYITKLCSIFDEVKRVLKKEGTCWVNLGDTYGTISGNLSQGNLGTNKISYIGKFERYNKKGKHKCLSMIPFKFAIEMVNRGWILRNTIIWHKPNAMPQSVKDRFTVDFEYLFFFVKNKKYYFEQQLEQFISKPTKLRNKRNEGYGKAFLTPLGKGLRNGYEQGAKNKRTVWSINTKPCKYTNFAVYPEKLIEIPIKAGCPGNGIVLDPFMGSGTTAVAAAKQSKKFVGIELNEETIKKALKRITPYLEQTTLLHKCQQVREKEKQ